MVPNIWYRLRMQVPAAGPAGSTLDITGVTLPGVPLMIVGSNRHVAWAFTNSTLDTTDLVPLEVNPADPALYRTPDGWKRVESVEEVLRVRGGRDETLKVETTLWGPLLPVTAGSPRRAIAWVAHLPGSIDLKFMEMEKAETVEQSVALAPHCGIPAQNLVVGDRQGKIGWTLVGRLPDRFGLDGQFPESWAAGTKGWRGFLSAEKYPRMMNPASGRLWTANNRVSGDPAYLVLGAWGVDNGARARQIRDGLNHLTSASPADMLAIQLDDRAVFLARWQKLMLGIIGRPSLKGNRELEEMRRLVESWEGRASTTSCGYRFVRDFRENTIKHLTEPLLQRCRAYYPEFRFRGVQLEGPAWKLLTHKPPHLLNPRFQSYEALLESALLEALKNYQALKRPLAELTWGNRNLVAIRHPLSLGLSWLGWWLDMSSVELPGDSNMPRVHSPRAGASQRLAVSPGHEEEGYFHMPCGQSGHFLSPFYRAGHQAWVLGKPLPFLPGPARYRLTLNPEPIREGF
jgi:penicillin amidase